ncbi:MAG: FAD-dependent oxidoreductase [Oscillospiraceae bacterium]|nr:FAD-dependent oxidoreductase [Oscillospiraceae bacterium]
MKTVIIGGVAGGASAAARLRRLDEKAEIIIMERGDYVSFANCGLPYFIGGVITDKKMLTLQTPESFRARFNIDVRVKNEVVKFDPERNTVLVNDLTSGRTYEETYDDLILSPGAKPVIPDIEGTDSEGVFTLRNIPDTYAITDYIENRKPASAVIIGGGYIGVEMAENLIAAGLKVTIAELSDHIIGPLDFEMAADIHKYIREKGVNLITGSAVRKISDTGHGLELTLDSQTLTADMVIMSVGVSPDTSLAAKCGIMLNRRGSIVVDKNMKTNYDNIYAVGDAAEVHDFITDNSAFIPLAGPANKQGRIAADNICGIASEYTGTQGSSILKIFEMTAAATGINEKTAKAAGIDYDKTYIYSGSHAGYYPGAVNILVKALWDRKTLKLIGAQIVGFDGVDKRIDVLASAIRFGAEITDLTSLELSYAPPFSSAKDPVNMLGFVAQNVVTGKLKQFFWDEVNDLPRDGSVTLLDVRTKTEYQRGNIDGFVNIPLDTLRDHLDEIPRDKPVYVHCHSGMRSYIACRLLTGNGFDCYNLAGGWRLFESAINEKTVPEYICTQCR